jgi:hypothetical protein
MAVSGPPTRTPERGSALRDPIRDAINTPPHPAGQVGARVADAVRRSGKDARHTNPHTPLHPPDHTCFFTPYTPYTTLTGGEARHPRDAARHGLGRRRRQEARRRLGRLQVARLIGGGCVAAGGSPAPAAFATASHFSFWGSAAAVLIQLKSAARVCRACVFRVSISHRFPSAGLGPDSGLIVHYAAIPYPAGASSPPRIRWGGPQGRALATALAGAGWAVSGIGWTVSGGVIDRKI